MYTFINLFKKKLPLRINDFYPFSDSSDNDGGSDSSTMDTDEAQLLKAEASMPIKKVTGEENRREDTTKVGKLKDAKVKKPELMSAKQNVDTSPKRPRGRPTMGREYR